MKIRYLGIFFWISVLILANENDLDLERLERLKAENMISDDEYMIFKSELLGNEGEVFYTLRVNGREIERFYPVMNYGDKKYLDMTTLLDGIEIKNYLEQDRIKLVLGENLRRVEIDLKSGRIMNNGEVISENPENIMQKDNKIFLEESIFAKLFALDLRVDEQTSRVSVALNFSPPDELLKRLDLKAEALKEERKGKQLLYQSERKLFEPGYLRLQAKGILTKGSGESKYKEDWGASVGYQGGLLYGQLQLNYDIKEERLGTLQLEYNEIWKNHTLQIYGNSVGEPNNSWGLSFFKDKSYYTDGKKVIIRESVPMGSRVELRYMGNSIAIQNEENGVVVFENSLITTDRTYTLVIFTPDGQVYEKTIKTTQDFDLQNKGEFQYNININEDSTSSKYTGNIDVHYGLTNSLTIGAGFARGIEEINGKYRYTHDLNANITYGATYNGLSYVLGVKAEKGFDNYKDGNKDFDDKFKYGGVLQLGYWRLRYTYQRDEMGSYFTDRYSEGHEVQFDVTDYLRMTYEYDRTKKFSGETDKDMNLTVSFNKSIGKVLLSADYRRAFYGSNKGDEYSVSAYYTTRNNISAKWENKWTERTKEFETIFSIYNNNFRGFIDYNLELGYSDKYREKVTFKLNLELADWLKIDSSFDKGGTETHSIGFDKVVDVRSVRQNIDSMDLSRVKAITFVDENNNNIFDVGEKVVEGVDVTIGEKTVTTNEDGEAMFHGVSNGVIYNLNPVIKKPSFTLGENKIAVKGNFSSTIEAYIPIKPMLNLTGQVKLGENMRLSELQREKLYQDILIEIKDMNGNSIELTVPDNTGAFDVSGLYPEKYMVEVNYLGTDYDLKKISEILKLTYIDNSFENKISLKVTEDSITMSDVEHDFPLDRVKERLAELEKEDKVAISERANQLSLENKKEKVTKKTRENRYSVIERKEEEVPLAKVREKLAELEKDERANQLSLENKKEKVTKKTRENRYSVIERKEEEVPLAKVREKLAELEKENRITLEAKENQLSLEDEKMKGLSEDEKV